MCIHRHFVLLGFVACIALLADGQVDSARVPIAIQSDPAVAEKYTAALKSNPAALGGQYKDSPAFVGGQAYSYEHCVSIAKWHESHSGDFFKGMSAIQLGNLWYTLDGCQFIYALYADPDDRQTAKNIPVNPLQYDEDCRMFERVLHVVVHDYVTRLDQVVAALPSATRLQVQKLLGASGSQFHEGFALLEYRGQTERSPSSLLGGWRVAQTSEACLGMQAVGDFVSVESSKINKAQQVSTSGSQQVPQRSLGTNKIQQVSIVAETWFGTRGSEVQILSPRPIFFKTKYLRALARPPGFSATNGVDFVGAHFFLKLVSKINLPHVPACPQRLMPHNHWVCKHRG